MKITFTNEEKETMLNALDLLESQISVSGTFKEFEERTKYIRRKITDKRSDKELIQEEILALLDEGIDNENEDMKDFYTIAEIAREVLLALDKKKFIR